MHVDSGQGPKEKGSRSLAASSGGRGLLCVAERQSEPRQTIISGRKSRDSRGIGAGSELHLLSGQKKLNSVALVRERTIPTERPPLGEVNANFCG
jgi:hypothetical protein